MHSTNKYLMAAAVFCALAALGHLGCILFGGDWYRFFGAGEQMARMSEEGHWYPAAVTSVIVIVLALWSFYALSGAGVIRRLPLLRTALCIIACIFLFRGVSFVALMPMFPENSLTFWVLSSALCLTIGICFAVGTYQEWPKLSCKNARQD
ncbi:hypothetical protein [Aliidiomarina soli]|uniref:DUF3995 domain-containing protein n=1 Tax=Aliidiomarina soli TaxID=1928574 RepID=A0A432WC50_9GAMM|nr:hypothetical protein [Aliidiomarina soli]RUO29565.1 hypothetical protein CWE14_13980 [Aliidiomarina soli]